MGWREDGDSTGVGRFVVGPDGALTLQGVRLFVNAEGELVAATRNGSTVIAP